MTNKERIEQLEAKVDELCSFFSSMKMDEQLQKKTGRWKPEETEMYFLIDQDTDVLENIWRDSKFDNYCYSQGNCFQTEQEAEEHLEYLKTLGRVKLYIEDNHWFEPDWDDVRQSKYSIVYRDNEEFKPNYQFIIQYLLVLPYLSSREACDDVIENCKEDLLIIFKIK